MAYEFKKLSEMELLDSVPAGATVLAEVDGVIRRVPSTGLGGDTGGGSGDDSTSSAPPEFDLTAMGLPVVPIDGTVVDATGDMAEFCEVLGRDRVKISLTVDTGGSEFPVSWIATSMLMGDTYCVSYVGVFDSVPMMFVLYVMSNGIQAHMRVLMDRTSLTDVSQEGA